MTVSEQCLVAICCFLLLGKALVTWSKEITIDNTIVHREPIKLFFCTKTECFTRLKFYDKNARSIEIIGGTELIPARAFENANNLRFIKGVNKNIRILASQSFINLPVLENIDLSFNLIRYIHHDVFVNVSVRELNLSWNKIRYSEGNFFDGMKNLENLDLSHNEITVFPDLPSMPPLRKLNLSYNFLITLEISSKTYPDLTVLDLSFNELEEFAITSKTPMKKIDLTNNQLVQMHQFEVGEVDELSIAMNAFQSIPANIFEGHTKIRKISIYPNYWNCGELRRLWNKLYEHNITLLRSDDDYRIAKHDEKLAICYDYENVYQYGIIAWETNRKFMKDNHLPCGEDDHICFEDELCRNRQCYNPCKQNVCHSTSLCKAENHKFECDCPTNRKKDPMVFNSRCYTVECFLDQDCDYPSICKAHVCQEEG